MKLRSIGIFLTLSIILAQAQAAALGDCMVHVKSIRKSGESSQRDFHYKAATKTPYEKLARAHRTNYAPQVIEKVEVKVDFSSEAKRP